MKIKELDCSKKHDRKLCKLLRNYHAKQARDHGDMYRLLQGDIERKSHPILTSLAVHHESMHKQHRKVAEELHALVTRTSK